MDVSADIHREDGFWVCHINGQGVTQAAQWDEIPDAVRDYVATLHDVALESVTIKSLLWSQPCGCRQWMRSDGGWTRNFCSAHAFD